MEDLGKVLFNLTRFQILQAKLNKDTSDSISDDYAYAWEYKLYPLMSENALHEDLEKYFSITREQVDEISKYADDEFNKGKLYNFYEYEAHYGVSANTSEGITRWTLIAVFRYFYLQDGFSDAFWKKLIEPQRHPTEATSITREYRNPFLF